MYNVSYDKHDDTFEVHDTSGTLLARFTHSNENLYVLDATESQEVSNFTAQLTVATSRIVYASIDYLSIGSKGKHVVYRSIVVVAIKMAALRVWLIRALRRDGAPINESNTVVHGRLSSMDHCSICPLFFRPRKCNFGILIVL